MREDARDPGQGDFLIRGVIGVDRQSGAIAIADSVLEGEIIQFHLRDALTAQEDLEMMLIPQMFCDPPSGALLFSCNGRGTKLYDYPDGDITIVQKNLAGVPVAGFSVLARSAPLGMKTTFTGIPPAWSSFARPSCGSSSKRSLKIQFLERQLLLPVPEIVLLKQTAPWRKSGHLLRSAVL